MSYYRLRRNGLEFPVAGLQAMESMILKGDLVPEQRVYDPATQEWRPASEVEELQAAFIRRRELASISNSPVRPAAPRRPPPAAFDALPGVIASDGPVPIAKRRDGIESGGEIQGMVLPTGSSPSGTSQIVV